MTICSKAHLEKTPIQPGVTAPRKRNVQQVRRIPIWPCARKDLPISDTVLLGQKDFHFAKDADSRSLYLPAT